MGAVVLRSEMPRSVAMELSGHKTESIFRMLRALWTQLDTRLAGPLVT